MVLNFRLLANTPCITSTFDVSKLDKSNIVIEPQSQNKFPKLVTFEVSKLLTFTLVRFLHPSNMDCIFVTFDVSKLLKSRVLIALQ